jgi:hypothetical protein
MPCKNLLFADAVIGKKSIRCLRRSPVLASEWDASTDLLGKLTKQSAEPLAVSKILKLATRHLAF